MIVKLQCQLSYRTLAKILCTLLAVSYKKLIRKSVVDDSFSFKCTVYIFIKMNINFKSHLMSSEHSFMQFILSKCLSY